MQLPPLEVILSWPTPNYIDPKTGGSYNDIVTLILLPIAWIIIGLRLFTRLWISKNAGLDDWLIVAALFPTTAFGISNVVLSLTFGWNRHSWDIPIDHITKGLKLILVMEVLFVFAAALTKMSMLALTYRIMGDSHPWMARVVKVSALLIVLDLIALSFLDLFQCRPISDYWKLTLESQPTCLDDASLLLAGGILNTLSDFLVVVLPIPRVLMLQLPARQRAIIATLLGVGLMVTIAGAVRTYFTYVSATSNDRTWALHRAWVTGSLELYIGIICACVPSLKKLVIRYIPKILRSSPTQISNSAIPRFNYQLSSIATIGSGPGKGAKLDSRSSRVPPYRPLTDPEDRELNKKTASDTTTSLNHYIEYENGGSSRSNTSVTEHYDDLKDQEDTAQLSASFPRPMN